MTDTVGNRPHAHMFSRPVLLESGGTEYQCTTAAPDGGACPATEFRPPNEDPLIEAILIGLRKSDDYHGLYLEPYDVNRYEIDGMVDMAGVAAELRSRFRIIPIERIGFEHCRRDHLGCQHEIHFNHSADERCPARDGLGRTDG